MASKTKKTEKNNFKGRLLDDIRKLDDVVFKFSDLEKTRKFRGITLDPRSGHLLVTDIHCKEVCIVDVRERGQIVDYFKLKDSGSATNGIAVTSEGLIAVSDYYGKKVGLYTPKGEFVRLLTEDLGGPNGVCVDQNGNIFVADSAHKRIRVFGSQGNMLYEYGNNTPERKLEPGNTLNWPFQVCSAVDGLTYVTDVQDNNVKVFDCEGNFVRKIGVGKLNGPSGITMSCEGYIVTSSIKADNNAVSFFTVNGMLRHSLSPLDKGGESRGVVTHDDGFIFVTDDINHSIIKL